MIHIYTDGACSSKTLAGGWALAAIENDTVVETHGGGELDTTNNRMELQAFLSALELTKEKYSDSCVAIYTDSAYISNCFKDKWYIGWQNNNWISSSKKPVKNQDLWKPIIALYLELEDTITVVKVKAHNGDKYNELVDKLAVSGRMALV